jgi:hypothetical protein
MGSSPEREWRGRRGEGQGAWLAVLEVGGSMGSSCIGEGSPPFTPCFCSVHANCCVRKKGGKREKRRKKKMKEKKKRKKCENFSKHENFRGEKIKDNL